MTSVASMVSRVVLHVALVAALAISLASLPGCSRAASEQKLSLVRVDAPLKEPVWVPEKDAILALSEDGRRVMRVDVGVVGMGSRAVSRSKGFKDIGENLALSPEEPELAYLPRPGSGRISALDAGTLRVVDAYDAGDAPSYVTLDVQSEILFALSETGSSVSGAELESHQELPATGVEGDAQALVESPEKGLDPAFWIAGPGGIAFYGGDPPERMVGRPTQTSDLAVDLTGSQRAYAAEGERVVALEGDPEGLLEGKLLVDATRDLGQAVEHVASDELYVFAASGDELAVLRRDTLEPVETLGFGRLLEREGITPEGISGIAVGDRYVYLTLEGEPYVLGVKKP